MNGRRLRSVAHFTRFCQPQFLHLHFQLWKRPVLKHVFREAVQPSLWHSSLSFVLDAVCYSHAFLFFIASGLLSYLLTVSFFFPHSYTSFCKPFSWSKPLWFSPETPSESHFDVLTSRAHCNHRQLPVLASCQHGKAILAKFVLCFFVTRALESHANGAAPVVFLLGWTWSVAPAGQWMFSERGCCSFAFSSDNRSRSPKAPCPFFYPSQLHVLALPLSLLMTALLGILELPGAQQGAWCLPWCGSAGKARWGCWGLEQESLRAGALRLGQMTPSSYSSQSRSPLIPLFFSGKLL